MKIMPKTINATKVFSLLLILFGLDVGVVPAQTPGGVQVVRQVKRGNLSATAGAANPGEVNWGFWSKGKAGAGCTLTSDGTNNDEIMMRVKDNGGMSGDPICELSLRFDSLKNRYTFAGVTIVTFPGACGNAPCAPIVLKPGTPGSNFLDLTVSGKMKGTVLPGANSIFRVIPTVRGPAGFDPFVEQAKPDLVVSKIDKVANLSVPGSFSVALTLANLGDAGWINRQAFAYSTDTNRAVLITLLKDNAVCGSRSVTLSQFDPNQELDSVNRPVALTWPGCTFSGTASFTATVDVSNRLFERQETSGKSKTVQLQGSLVRQPR
ncbi:MAG TPA: hypothetical protein VJS64_12825 [Pyrinomonadaceae bacterium]|nr:hypothetical protein [Pyrinomonadaceae bacterium]